MNQLAQPLTLLTEIKSGERSFLNLSRNYHKMRGRELLFEEDVRIKNDQHN